MIKNHKVVPGGGASELACSIAINEYADTVGDVQQYAIRGFADALEEIPIALATNCGYNPIQYLSEIKKEQKGQDGKVANPNVGVVLDDFTGTKSRDMFENGVYESLMSKK